MDQIKEAFNRVKSDMDSLQNELEIIKKESKENKELVAKICGEIHEIFNKINQINIKQGQIKNSEDSAHQQINPAHLTNLSADNVLFRSLKPKNWQFSIGNEGVPADRQTNQQTDRQQKNSIESAVEMIKSLDNLKREIYKKFKGLTEQEWMVFAAIYQLDEEIGYSDYSILAEKLKLSESSIRDYVSKLIKKGISLDKNKINNKHIKLNIPQSLKQVASLSAILALRDS